VSTRGPIVRLLLGAGAFCALVVALIGGVALRTSGVVAVVLAGTVAACLALGLAREAPERTRWRPAEVAVLAAAWTVGALLVLSGTAALAGGVVAALVAGVAGSAGLAYWLLHAAGTARAAREARALEDTPRPWPVPPSGSLPGSAPRGAMPTRTDVAGAARVLPPVSALPTDALGREWLRTSAALAGRLEPAARSSIVRRRQAALDELERRDPDGFARWLAAGPAPGSDPARYVGGGPAAGTQAA
jgi:hypothetical protein